MLLRERASGCLGDGGQFTTDSPPDFIPTLIVRLHLAAIPRSRCAAGFCTCGLEPEVVSVMARPGLFTTPIIFKASIICPGYLDSGSSMKRRPERKSSLKQSREHRT